MTSVPRPYAVFKCEQFRLIQEHLVCKFRNYIYRSFELIAIKCVAKFSIQDQISKRRKKQHDKVSVYFFYIFVNNEYTLLDVALNSVRCKHNLLSGSIKLK